MLATLHEGPTDDAFLGQPGWVFETKLDGMRVLALVEPGEVAPRVTLWTRNGREKTAQFPELTKDLKRFARTLKRPVLLDGEVVAVDRAGEPLGFQRLAGRIHLTGDHTIAAEAARAPVAFVVFDVLRDGGDDLRPLTLVQRRSRLEKVIGNAGSGLLRLAEQSAGGDGRRWLARAVERGWEGLIAKDAESPYHSGRRSPRWRKLKLPKRQELVIGGWTEPRGARQHFGALLVGYYEPTPNSDRPLLRYAGSVGTGFDDAMLRRLGALLQTRAMRESPFASTPAPPPHSFWVRPELVAEVKFTEWTDERMLRHPVFLGLRDDLNPLEVRREPQSALRVVSESGRRPNPKKSAASPDAALTSVAEQLHALEEARRDGTLALPDGQRLDISNPAKVFWAAHGITKGELLRHYVRVSPWLLPVLADRPLIMKRFPNGVNGKAFYQQRAPEDVPDGVRVEQVEEGNEMTPRLVGGTLLTLLYTTQLAAISQDPWFSRVQSRHHADYAALDLDPMPGVPFSQVRDVARFLGDELATLNIVAGLKTSGASGLHLYIPLSPETPYEAGQLLCQILAT
ncbi:MAG: non-homologous end-joining DNA ligase, partial [Vicinamibacterales bacterium]